MLCLFLVEQTNQFAYCSEFGGAKVIWRPFGLANHFCAQSAVLNGQNHKMLTLSASNCYRSWSPVAGQKSATDF